MDWTGRVLTWSLEPRPWFRMKYNVFAAFRILETHERRLLRQAEAAVASAS